MIDPGTRCCQPLAYYELSGRPRADLSPVCWRPAGHPGAKHLSEYAYRKILERARHRRTYRKPRRGPAAAA